MPESLLTSSLGKSGKRNRFSTVFAKESAAAVAARRLDAAEPLDTSRRGAALVAHDVLNHDPVLAHPTGVLLASGAALRERGVYLSADARGIEETAFTAWLEALYARYSRAQVNYFEHSLDVWQQLWHTLATADVIAIVADVRNPLWHLPASLYHQVITALRKPLVVVLNKVDLVPPAAVAAWTAYLTATLGAGVAIVPFSSSGASLGGITALSARRKAIRDARKAFNADNVRTRAACVRALLAAAGTPPATVDVVVDALLATIDSHVAAPRRRGDALSDDDRDDAGPAAVLHGIREEGGKVDLIGDDDDDAEAGDDGGDDDDGGGDDDDGDDDDGDDDDDGGSSVESGDAPGGGGGFQALADALHSSDDGGSDDDGEDEAAAPLPSSDSFRSAPSVLVHAPRPAAAVAAPISVTGDVWVSDKSERRRARKLKKAGLLPAAAAAAVMAATAGAAGSATAAAAAAAAAARYTGPTLTIGMVGHPNAGKSSVINTVCGNKRVSVSRTAGHTKRAQTVPVAPGLALLDCPGLVFPHALVPPPEGVDAIAAAARAALPPSAPPAAADAAAAAALAPILAAYADERAMQELLGVVPIAQVRESYTALRLLAATLPLERLYGLALPSDEPRWSPLLLAEALAVKRGLHIARTGRPDAHAAGRSVLYDSQDGILPLYWMPPASGGGGAPPPPPAC